MFKVNFHFIGGMTVDECFEEHFGERREPS